jgi:hypothetical protein
VYAVFSLPGFDALVGSFVTNWGMSLGLEELDISGNEGEDSSDKFAQYAKSGWLFFFFLLFFI